MRRFFIAFIMIFICVVVMLYSNETAGPSAYPMRDYYLLNAFSQSGATNAVTSIYLFYRLYDTLFETLMLLFSIIGVIYMSVHDEEEADDDF